MMKKFVLLFLPLLMLLSVVPSTSARVSVGINVGIPFPAFSFSIAPSLVVIPGTYVYMVPDVDFDIFFYEGWWYRPWEGRWCRALSYNGPWGYIETVPQVLITLPPGYAYWRAGGGPRFSYGYVRDHWRGWERQRYWDHDPGWRSGWAHRTEWGHPGWHHEGGWRAGEKAGNEVGKPRMGQRRESGATSIQSIHRKMGVAPRFEEHRGPGTAPGHREPMNRASRSRPPTHGKEHGR